MKHNKDIKKKLKGMEGRVLASFSMLYKRMGKIKKSEEFGLKSLDILKSIYNENHTLVMLIRGIYQKQKDFMGKL